MFLGDSLLSGVGVGVGIAGQFTTLVSDLLPGTSIVILELPVSSPEHLFPIFRRFGAPLHPKIVFACLYVASDVDTAKHSYAGQKAGQQWVYDDFRAN